MLVADDALFVHNEDRSLGEALGTKDAVLLRYFAVRPEVAQQRDLARTQRLGPGGVRRCAVYAYTQNLGIYRLEAFQVGFVGRDLLRSNGRPGQRVEGKNDVLVLPIVAEPNVAPSVI